MSQTDPSPEESLCLILGGNPRDMDAGRVSRTVDLLTALVRSFTPTSDKAKIGVMRGGDSGMEVLSSAAISREILAGIATIEKESALPRNWSLAQVKNLREFARLAGAVGIGSVSIRSSVASSEKQLTPQVAHAIDEMIEELPLSLGSVTGFLDGYTVTKAALEATIQPDGGGPSVTVKFARDLDEQIRGAVAKKVNVYGVLKRSPESDLVLEVDAQSVMVLSELNETPNGLGIWRELKDEGATVEELMQGIRED